VAGHLNILLSSTQCYRRTCYLRPVRPFRHHARIIKYGHILIIVASSFISHDVLNVLCEWVTAVHCTRSLSHYKLIVHCNSRGKELRRLGRLVTRLWAGWLELQFIWQPARDLGFHTGSAMHPTIHSVGDGTFEAVRLSPCSVEEE
jgi:hypothetical protein